MDPEDRGGSGGLRVKLCVIQIISLAIPRQTPYDGKYLKTFDPYTDYPRGHLTVTGDPNAAMIFSDSLEAARFWSRSYGTRTDGKPHKPLTAFTVAILPLDIADPL